MGRQDQVKTAIRTLDLFEVFALASAPLTLTEVARRMGTPISSVHALIRTLQARGYVYVLDERKRVYPTKRLVTIAQGIAKHDPILDRLAPVLGQLHEATGETIIVGKRQSNWVIYLDVIEGRHTIRYAASPGDTKPLHSSAIGKAMLGLLSPGEEEQMLKRVKLSRVTERTIVSCDALRTDLAEGRRKGYFVTRGENVPDVMGIAIAQRIGDESYGVAIAGPIERLDARFDDYIAALGRAKRALEHVEPGEIKEPKSPRPRASPSRAQASQKRGS